MMLFVCIAWILIIANAPWWIWVAFTAHIVGCIVNWLFGNNDKFNKLIKKL